MNMFRTRRYFRDEIVELLDKEAGGSFATLTKALENVTAKYPPNTELRVEEVVQEIHRINAKTGAGAPRVRKTDQSELLKTG